MHLNKSMARFLSNFIVIVSALFLLSPDILHAAWGLNMREGATPISQDVYNMHMTSLYVVTVIGILVFGVMFWSIFHHRKSKGVKPAKFSHSTTVEVIWTLIPFAIIVALAIPATKLLARMDDTSKSEITIKATGYQWKWKYDYIDEDITIYSNFLRFYRGLEEYSKNTKQLSPEAVGVRDAISKAKDPETALFELIPRALGFTSLSKLSKNNIEFLDALKLAIKEIRTAYSNLVDTLEQNILKSIGIKASSFEESKYQITEKFSSIDVNLISNDRVKIFYNRVMSPLDVKHAYWESLADAVLGKRLDKIQDNEIPYLIEQLKSNFNMLTDFIVLHENSKQSKEEIIQLNFLSSNGQINFKKNIIKKVELEAKSTALKNRIEQILDKDSDVNKLTLVNILTNLFKD